MGKIVKYVKKQVVEIGNKIELILPLKVSSKLSLNSVYSNNHWTIRKRQAEDIHTLVKLELLSKRIPRKIFDNPIRINFYWNSMLDLDNHGYLTKLIIDGFKGYLIHDDTKKYVQEIHHSYWLGKGVKIEISEILRQV